MRVQVVCAVLGFLGVLSVHAHPQLSEEWQLGGCPSINVKLLKQYNASKVVCTQCIAKRFLVHKNYGCNSVCFYPAKKSCECQFGRISGYNFSSNISMYHKEFLYNMVSASVKNISAGETTKLKINMIYKINANASAELQVFGHEKSFSTALDVDISPNDLSGAVTLHPYQNNPARFTRASLYLTNGTKDSFKQVKAAFKIRIMASEAVGKQWVVSMLNHPKYYEFTLTGVNVQKQNGSCHLNYTMWSTRRDQSMVTIAVKLTTNYIEGGEQCKVDLENITLTLLAQDTLELQSKTGTGVRHKLFNIGKVVVLQIPRLYMESSFQLEALYKFKVPPKKGVETVVQLDIEAVNFVGGQPKNFSKQHFIKATPKTTQDFTQVKITGYEAIPYTEKKCSHFTSVCGQTLKRQSLPCYIRFNTGHIFYLHPMIVDVVAGDVTKYLVYGYTLRKQIAEHSLRTGQANQLSVKKWHHIQNNTDIVYVH